MESAGRFKDFSLHPDAQTSGLFAILAKSRRETELPVIRSPLSDIIVLMSQASQHGGIESVKCCFVGFYFSRTLRLSKSGVRGTLLLCRLK